MTLDQRARDEVRDAVALIDLPPDAPIKFEDVLELMVQSWKRGYSAAKEH